MHGHLSRTSITTSL